MDVATIHTVAPGDIIGEHGQHAVYVPPIEPIVDAFKDLRRDLTAMFRPKARHAVRARPLA